jgi:hypothetical protein
LDAGFIAAVISNGHTIGLNDYDRPWLTFTGRTMAQELGDGWAQGVHPDDLDDCLRTYVHQFDSRQPFRKQYRLQAVGAAAFGHDHLPSGSR